MIRSLIDSLEGVEATLNGAEAVLRTDIASFSGVVQALKEGGFDLFVDLTAVDHLNRRSHRFEVIVNLVSISNKARARIHVAVPGDDPVIPSISGIYPGANFFEREVFDMFGIGFEGHPDLTRILLPDEWEGHPLRKDYAVGSVPVQFKGSNTVS